MIAILYEGKREKRRLTLSTTLPTLVDTLANGKPLVVNIPLRAPCKFDKLIIWDMGRKVLTHRFGQMCFNPGPFDITLSPGVA